MANVTTDRIRNVVLIGQSGAGSTSVAEALLYAAGASSRAGSVDAGTSVLDHEPEAIKRKISLSLALAPVPWTTTDGTGYLINLLDTPGYPDFIGEVEAALAVADLAVLVVSAVDGVEVGSEALWQRAAEIGLPRMVFVNKDDRERADFHAVLAQLGERLGPGFVALELPLGEAAGLHGVADVLSEEAIEYDASGHHSAPLPDDIAAEEHALHDAVVEDIVSGDDTQLERYLGGESLTTAELTATLAGEVLAGTEFPVLVGSATTGVGIDRLADFICALGPSPAQRPATVTAGDTAVEVPADPDGHPLIHVFKTITDPFVGQLSLFKVLSGTVRTDAQLTNSTTGANERLHALYRVCGKEQSTVSEIPAGGIGAVAKLANTHTGDTLSGKGQPVRVAPPRLPVAHYAVAIVAATQADDDKLSTALARLQSEDPLLGVERNDETHQTVVRGFGDTHVAVSLERLARKFGVRVTTEDVRVAYRETITGHAAAQGRVKKQTGGHGQFAVVDLRVSAGERGSGFEFVDSIVGGAIPRSYVPAVAKGVEETMSTGGVHGFPVVDVRVECVDGKFHAVDSSEMAFKTAAAQGFKDALAGAAPVILEPISAVEVHVPADSQGEVMGDLTARRGRLQGSDVDHRGRQVITALVPTSELAQYAIALRSMTAGRAHFDMRHDHYDVLPAHLEGPVKAQAAKAREESAGRKK